MFVEQIELLKRFEDGATGEIELATSSLPMRCYTTKPRWRRPCHQAFRYNRRVLPKYDT